MSSGSALAQCASSAARPPAAARFSATIPGDQPANQSSPPALNGAGAGHAHRGGDALWQQRGAGQRVRAAAE